jgi:repressor LexA
MIMANMTTTNRAAELTQRQTEVLQVIRNHIESTGAPPTRAEIAKQLGFRSVNAAEDHLKALARKGAIVLSPGTSRGIQLSGKHGLGLPIIKASTTDTDLLAEENIQARLRIENQLFSSKPDFLLSIHDNSLKNAGIKSGDLLAVHIEATAQRGDLIVARYNQNLVVRRYLPEGGQIILRAENSDFPDITVPLNHEHFKIEGIGVGIIRTGKP